MKSCYIHSITNKTLECKIYEWQSKGPNFTLTYRITVMAKYKLKFFFRWTSIRNWMITNFDIFLKNRTEYSSAIHISTFLCNFSYGWCSVSSSIESVSFLIWIVHLLYIKLNENRCQIKSFLPDFCPTLRFLIWELPSVRWSLVFGKFPYPTIIIICKAILIWQSIHHTSNNHPCMGSNSPDNMPYETSIFYYIRLTKLEKNFPKQIIKNCSLECLQLLTIYILYST